MSFYFTIKTKKEISYKLFVDNIGIENVQFHLKPYNLNDSIENVKIYIPKKSTRGVSIYREEHGYSIGLNVIASNEDFHLAINVSKVIGQLTNGEIIAEDSDEILNCEQLTDRYNQDWIDLMKTTGISMFLKDIGHNGHVLVIGGCYMNYYIGPRIHSTLDSSSELNYYNSLIDHIQKTQFFDISKYQIATLITTLHENGRKKKSVVIFYPSGNEFLSFADYVVFPADNGRYEISYDIIPLIADSKFKRIDEKQFTIDSLNPTEYENILERIEQVLGNATEEELVLKYSNFANHELNDEHKRISSLPDAHLKIFALQRMSCLNAEFERRNIPLPTSNVTKSNSIEDNEGKVSSEVINVSEIKDEIKLNNTQITTDQPIVQQNSNEVQKIKNTYNEMSKKPNNFSSTKRLKIEKMLDEAKRDTENRFSGSTKEYIKKWWQFWK